MENLSRNIENQEVKSVNRLDFDEENYEQNLKGIHEEDIEEKKQREPVIDGLITELFEDNDKTKEVEDIGKTEEVEKVASKEEVEKFIWENCQEPIEKEKEVNNVIFFKDLVDLLVQSAKDEFDRIKSSGAGVESEEYKNALEIKNKLELFEKKNLSDEEKEQLKWIAKDHRIYNLPAYENLINKWWFILPSDVRNYYDSANGEPVHHLWIDYNVQSWTPVSSIYDGEVVVSGEDYDKEHQTWFWHKVIIKHKIPNGPEFYSLYGHIWAEWLPAVWDKVKKWKIIWKVWKPFEKDNWNWNAHLHFQIMEDKDSPRWYSKNEWEWNYDVLKSFGKK